MISENELFEKIEEAVRTVLNTEKGEITKSSMFKADLHAESIDYLDISYEIEQRTGIELDFTDALQYVTEKNSSEITDISMRDMLDYMMHVLSQKEK
ncbi:MAG: acyl carrier protein [Chlorobium sp.]|nr:MAG: acyl carrier protein [Chlorobium sp.]